MNRSASAVWQGGLKDGKGTISLESGVLKGVAYDFKKRFETDPGTNPEELIAAAHASCFSMALSGQLGNAGMTADTIETKCTVTFEKTDAGFTITESHLETKVKVPNADKEKFETAVQNAKAGCPISRVLNTKITLHAELA
jgi:osmotically inducible protein OsmC